MSQKGQIIEESLQQFLANGIKNTTLNKIVLPLGISTKTFYRYFVDKEDLVKVCIELHYNRLTKDISNHKFPNSLETLLFVWHKGVHLDFGINSLFYKDLNDYYPEFQAMIEGTYFQKITVSISNLINASIKEGLIDDFFNVDIVYKTMTILYGTITRTEEYTIYHKDPFYVFQNTLLIYIKGLCTSKGIEIFNNFEYTKE